MADMLHSEVVPLREIIVTANVALSSGSSQHGTVRRACVLYRPVSRHAHNTPTQKARSSGSQKAV